MMMLMMGREGEGELGRAQSACFSFSPFSFSTVILVCWLCLVCGWVRGLCRKAAQVVLWARARMMESSRRTALPCHRPATSSSQTASPCPRRRTNDYSARSKAHRQVAGARQGVWTWRRPFFFSAPASSEKASGGVSPLHSLRVALHNRPRHRRCASVEG